MVKRKRGAAPTTRYARERARRKHEAAVEGLRELEVGRFRQHRPLGVLRRMLVRTLTAVLGGVVIVGVLLLLVALF